MDTRPAWTVWMGQLVLAAFLVLGGLFLSQESGAAGLVLVFFALVIVGYVWYRRKRVRYVVTDRRVMILTGLSAKGSTETWMADIRGMQTGASLIERLLGHGTIIVSEQTLPRSSLNALAFIPLLSALPVFNAGKGLTLSGVSDYPQVANIIRRRQSDRKD